jgi:hypothetical protein
MRKILTKENYFWITQNLHVQVNDNFNSTEDIITYHIVAFSKIIIANIWFMKSDSNEDSNYKTIIAHMSI